MVDSFQIHSILTNHSPHFKSLWVKHRSRLITLIQQFLSQQRKHSSISRWKYLETQYLGSKELKKRFGGSGGYYKSVIQPYFDCVDEIYKKGNGGYTKKWKLKKWVVDEIVESVKDETTLTLTKIREDEKGIEEIITKLNLNKNFKYDQTITLNWYKKLIEWNDIINEVSFNRAIF